MKCLCFIALFIIGCLHPLKAQKLVYTNLWHDFDFAVITKRNWDKEIKYNRVSTGLKKSTCYLSWWDEKYSRP